MSKGHLAKYVKNAEKGKTDGGDNDDSDEEPGKKPANRVVDGVIAAIPHFN